MQTITSLALKIANATLTMDPHPGHAPAVEQQPLRDRPVEDLEALARARTSLVR